MNLFSSIRAETIQLDHPIEALDAVTLENMARFISTHYVAPYDMAFIEHLIQPNRRGLLINIYDAEDDLVGFTRIFLNELTVKNNRCIIYTANTYTTALHQLSAISLRQGLHHAQALKSEQPDTELLYFAEVNNAWRYTFYHELSTKIYPMAHKSIPQKTIALANEVKRLHQWQSSPKHPLIIEGQLPPRNTVISHELLEMTPSHQYFNALDLNAQKGEALLVYIPLDLINLSYAMRRLNASMQPRYEYILAKNATEPTESLMI